MLKMVFWGAAITVAGWVAFNFTVHNQLRDRVQAEFSSKLAASGFEIAIGDAKFVEGQGLRLSDIAIQKNRNFASKIQASFGSADYDSFIRIYEAFLHVPISVTELVTGDKHPQAIEIRRAKIQIRKQANGDWNLTDLIEGLQKIEPTGCGPLPVSLTDCSIDLVEPFATQQGGSSNDGNFQLTDVELQVIPIEHDGRSLMQIKARFDATDIRGVQLSGYYDSANQAWRLDNLSTEQIRLTKNLYSILPPSLKKTIGPIADLGGEINLTAWANGTTSLNQIPNFGIAGSLTDFSINDARMPGNVSRVNAKFQIDNQQIKVIDATGRIGQGTFAIDYHQSGLLNREQWKIAGHVSSFDFGEHEKYARWMPSYFGKFCSDYSPTGFANIEFNLAHDGANLTRKIHGELTDMSFAWVKLPYRAEHCTGDAWLIGDEGTFKVKSQAGEQSIGLKGFVRKPGPDATYQINISVPGELPIDGKMMKALEAQPKLSRIIKDFNPTGRVAGTGTIEKQIPRGAIAKTFDVRLKQCNIRHSKFDYPIHNVSGLVHVENDRYQFSELTGNNSSAKINCNGDWNPIDGLDVRLICNSVPLDDQLRFALRPELREIWQGFRPRGTIDLIKVDMTLPIGDSYCGISVDANMETPQNETSPNIVSINPTWFPYQINQLTGNVQIGEGKINLSNMQGWHQRSMITCEGDGHYANDSWSVKLQQMLVLALKIDEDLLAAIPANLAPPIRQLDYEGLVSVQGDVTLAGQHRQTFAANQQAAAQIPEHTTSMAWDVHFDMNQAKMKVGLPLENVYGDVHLIGRFDGQEAECRGDINIDSLTVYDAQITKVKGPIWLDNRQTAAGVFAVQQAQASTSSNFAPVQTEADKLESITGIMHGGVVRFDAHMNSDPTGEFYVQTTLADGNLKQFCQEFAPTLTQVAGRSFAVLKLTGNYLGQHSYRGDGMVQLRDAEIYELPVVLSLLKILKVKQINRTAFDSSNVDFTVEGDKIDLKKIELLGDAISLIGNGQLTTDRDVNLNFYSVMGRGRLNIPLLTDLYRASSQRILWINVDGTLDNPQFHRNVLPQVNDSLRQLFQPTDRTNIANNGNPFPAFENTPYFNQSIRQSRFLNNRVSQNQFPFRSSLNSGQANADQRFLSQQNSLSPNENGLNQNGVYQTVAPNSSSQLFQPNQSQTSWR